MELTPKEIEILRRISNGEALKVMALERGISVWGVAKYMAKARKVNNCKTLVQLAVQADRVGLLKETI
jgi:DNA-binding CsgD family transcriptional regulator